MWFKIENNFDEIHFNAALKIKKHTKVCFFLAKNVKIIIEMRF